MHIRCMDVCVLPVNSLKTSAASDKEAPIYEGIMQLCAHEQVTKTAPFISRQQRENQNAIEQVFY